MHARPRLTDGRTSWQYVHKRTHRAIKTDKQSRNGIIVMYIEHHPFSLFAIATSAIESVKRSFTKRLPRLKSLSYSKRLEVLGIDSLELRRLRCDLIYVYKMLFGLVDLNFNDYFTLKLSSRPTTRGHDYKLFLNFSRLNVRKRFIQ